MTRIEADWTWTGERFERGVVVEFGDDGAFDALGEGKGHVPGIASQRPDQVDRLAIDLISKSIDPRLAQPGCHVVGHPDRSSDSDRAICGMVVTEWGRG